MKVDKIFLEAEFFITSKLLRIVYGSVDFIHTSLEKYTWKYFGTL